MDNSKKITDWKIPKSNQVELKRNNNKIAFDNKGFETECKI